MPAVLASIVSTPRHYAIPEQHYPDNIKDKPEATDMPEAPPTTIASASSIFSSITRLHCPHSRLIFLWRQKQMSLKKGAST